MEKKTIKTFTNGKNRYQLNELHENGTLVGYETAFEVLDNTFAPMETFLAKNHGNDIGYTKRRAHMNFLFIIQKSMYEDIIL